MQWGAHGQLNGQDGVGVPVADAITSAIEGSNVVARRHSSHKVRRWRGSTDEVRRVIEVGLNRRLLLGIRRILLLLGKRRRRELGWCLLLLMLDRLLLLLLRRRGRGRLDLLVVARVGSRRWAQGQVHLL